MFKSIRFQLYGVRCAKMLNRGIKTMRAWQIQKYGKLEELQLSHSFLVPTITKTTDVLVKVHAASINPLDIWMLGGYGSKIFGFLRQVNNCSLSSNEFPLVLGRDFSGTVMYVGKDVTSLKCSDEVWGVTSPHNNGSHADYVLASAYSVCKKPETLNHVEASSLPYAALTAWSALCTFGGLSERSCIGKRVLVTGASGGVGTFAVQLLKCWGADVAVTCSTDAVEMLQNLGADCVLDYTSPDFRSNLSQLKGFDVIFDNVGKEYPDLTINLLKSWQNSKYVTIVSPLLKNADTSGLLFGTLLSATQAACDTVMSVKDGRSFRWAYFIPNGCALKSITRMVENKQIMPVVDETFKFEEALQAYDKVLQGHSRGKTVIDLTSSNNKITKE